MLNDMTAEDIEALFSEESDEKQENENKENWRELFGEDQEEDCKYALFLKIYPGARDLE